jgi:hypothetical protein
VVISVVLDVNKQLHQIIVMQPQPKDNSLVVRNKLRNPLLFVAEESFPFDNYPQNVLMPVTPEPPVVTQDGK